MTGIFCRDLLESLIALTEANAATRDKLVKIWFEFIAISFFYFFIKEQRDLEH